MTTTEQGSLPSVVAKRARTVLRAQGSDSAHDMKQGAAKKRLAVAMIALVLVVVAACSDGSGTAATGDDCHYAIGAADQTGNQTCSVTCIPYSVECARTAGGPAECTCSKGPKTGTTFSQVDCDVSTTVEHCK